VNPLAIFYPYEAAQSFLELLAASRVILVPSRSNLIVDTNHLVIGSGNSLDPGSAGLARAGSRHWWGLLLFFPD
jgi:hypothetical protein